VADALSRSPVQEADGEDMADAEELTRFSGEVMQVAAVAIEREDKSCEEEPGTRADRVLREMREVAEKDESYKELIAAVQEGKKLPAGFKGNDGRFSVDDGLVLLGQRLVVPQALRKEVLKRLHASHQGIERTLRRARQTVFWPGITSDIKATVENCEACQVIRPSQCKEPLEWDPPPTRVFQHLAADFYDCHGKAIPGHSGSLLRFSIG
jgi:hypothetical protein